MALTRATVRASCSASVDGTYPPQGVSGDLRDVQHAQTVSSSITNLTAGTGSGQVDLLTCSLRTLTTGSPTATYDLFAGATLLDLIGQTCALRKVKLIQIAIESGGDASGVAIGGAAADEWVGFFGAAGDKHKIFPAGPAYQAGSPAGVAVGSGTKNLLVENLGAVDVTVSILIAGTSA